MDYKELLEKYYILLGEADRLTAESCQLKAQIDLMSAALPQNNAFAGITSKNTLEGESIGRNCFSDVDSQSDTLSKINLFRSLFKGREDVYAKRWENKNKGSSGYSPVCLNQWQTGVCDKPIISCSKCKHKLYAALNEAIIENHLRGNIVVGIYPILPDETCCFLAMDFDEADWQKDISVFRDVCIEFNIPVAVERSRSGNGGHVWFFFENWVSAALARKFGTALLTCSMHKRHEIRFKSYDRLFPSQDTLPKGGLGDLIALPLQKAARENGNSVFVDEKFQAYDDQWAFLSQSKRYPKTELKNSFQTFVLVMGWGF